MTQVDEKVIELVRTALSFELGGEQFYRHAAEATEHPKGKEMFLKLAEAEKEHMNDVHDVFASLIGEETWKRLLAEELHHPHQSKVVAELEAAVAHRGHSIVADDTQALRLAMELERRAIKFFEDLAKHTDDPNLVDAVNRLADEERFHYDFLQGQLDSILNVGIWLDAAEFRVDAKF